MEIIEKGKKIFECSVCGCKFTLDKNDIIHHHDGVYSTFDYFLGDYKSKDYDYVLCPQCDQRVKVAGEGHIK